MKRRYFILAAIFLFNPVISVFDILPDFIGYLLLMKAFSNASYVYDNADETRYAFKAMAVVSIFKLVSLVILPFTDATMALVFSFSFAIIEVLFGFGAYQRLFDTTSFICMRCSADYAVRKSESLKRFTVFFFVVRIVCSTAPDLFALFLSNPQKAWMYRFRLLFFIILTAIALIVGIIWLSRMISFFKSVLTEEIKNKIDADFKEEMKDRQSVFFSKDFIFAISVISISMLFTIDLTIDKIEMLSDMFLAPIYFCAMMFLWKKRHIIFGKIEKLLIFVLASHFVSSILNIVFLARYNKEYLLSSLIRNENARKMFIPVHVFNAFEAISFFAIAFITLYLFKKYSVKRIYENPKFFAERSVDGYVKEYTSALNKRIKYTLILAGVSAISTIVYLFVMPYKESYVAFNTLFAIVFFAVFINTLSFISDEIFKKILKYS